MSLAQGSGVIAQRAHGGLGAQGALLDGIRRVNNAPVILACVFLVTLLAALPFSVVLREALRASFGHSLAADEAARGVNYEWWTEFSAQASGIASTFVTSVIGFAAVLDNLSTLLDRGPRPAAIIWLGGAYIALWLFLAGGIIDRYARDRPIRSYGFFAACGVYFSRLLRLAPIMGLAYYVLFRYVHAWLFHDFYERVTREVPAERTAFLWRLALYAVFGLLLSVANAIFDYAKVRAVVEDRRSMLGALLAAFRFVRRHAGAVATLYVLNGSLFVGVLALYAIVAPGAGQAGPVMWLGFAVSQMYLLARLWVRLVFFASEVSLFQTHLAYTGYIATPPVRLPEPAIVEQLAGPKSR
jgi:hypothetical protein